MGRHISLLYCPVSRTNLGNLSQCLTSLAVKLSQDVSVVAPQPLVLPVGTREKSWAAAACQWDCAIHTAGFSILNKIDVAVFPYSGDSNSVLSFLTPLHLLYRRERLHHLERFPYYQTGYKISRAGTEFLDSMKKHWFDTHFI